MIWQEIVPKMMALCLTQEIVFIYTNTYTTIRIGIMDETRFLVTEDRIGVKTNIFLSIESAIEYFMEKISMEETGEEPIGTINIYHHHERV